MEKNLDLNPKWNWDKKVLKPSLYNFLYRQLKRGDVDSETAWKIISDQQSAREKIKYQTVEEHIYCYHSICHALSKFSDNYFSEEEGYNYVLDFLYLTELKRFYEKLKS